MIASIPSGWREVGLSEFEEFLKGCADYRRDSFSGGSYYSWARNDKRFAFADSKDRIWVDPSLLTLQATQSDCLGAEENKRSI